MARIRTIKPEFWTSEQVVECSRDARLLFIGLWNFADDAGAIPNQPKMLRMRIFPGEDDLRVDDVRRLLDELSTNGLLVEYKVDLAEFLLITGWEHQRIDRPAYKHPMLNGQTPQNQSDAKELRRAIVEHSTSTRRILEDRHPPEGKGREGKGKEGKGRDNSSEPQAALEPVILFIPLTKKDGEFGITQSDIDQWKDAYPAVDVLQKLREIRQWNFDNPSRRKTKNGIRKHISAWLAKEQDRGGTVGRRIANDIGRTEMPNQLVSFINEK